MTITGFDEQGGNHPATTETGRVVHTTSELTLSVPADNVGVLLRRRLDYAVPEQRAEILVADADDRLSPFESVGVWYTAGSTRSLFANAATETGVVAPVVMETVRRFRDDELLIARRFTQGRKRLRVRVVVGPAGPPLQPGDAPPVAAWSELGYRAYAWRMPTTWRRSSAPRPNAGP
jgi:hypothetical protein